MSARIKYGLIGRNISYSFSPSYFARKFAALGIDATYEIFDVPDLENIHELLNRRDIAGLNVTIPFKEQIIPHLDGLSEAAQAIGAVNTIAFSNGKRVGHNTDYIGFTQSLKPLLDSNPLSALILGDGGASKAVAYALKQMGIPFRIVSRKAAGLTYQNLTPTLIAEHRLIVNTTPLGTFPNVDAAPDVPYEGFTSSHIAYDLIYNPSETAFMKKAADFGAKTVNGYDMLAGQAEAAWTIWQAGL
jgi:shikimate dehydrogenase